MLRPGQGAEGATGVARCRCVRWGARRTGRYPVHDVGPGGRGGLLVGHPALPQHGDGGPRGAPPLLQQRVRGGRDHGVGRALGQEHRHGRPASAERSLPVATALHCGCLVGSLAKNGCPKVSRTSPSSPHRWRGSRWGLLQGVRAGRDLRREPEPGSPLIVPAAGPLGRQVTVPVAPGDETMPVTMPVRASRATAASASNAAWPGVVIREVVTTFVPAKLPSSVLCSPTEFDVTEPFTVWLRTPSSRPGR